MYYKTPYLLVYENYTMTVLCACVITVSLTYLIDKLRKCIWFCLNKFNCNIVINILKTLLYINTFQLLTGCYDI